MSGPSREQLIALCRDGIVPESKWYDRDSAGAQLQLGHAYALLGADCEYRVLHEKDGLNTNDKTIWLEITYRGFAHFDYDGGLERDTFYIPTRARLEAAAGSDWY